MIENVYLAFFITIVIAVGWLRIIDFLAAKGVFPAVISRKIIHIGTGPIFVLCWILFPEVPLSRYLAAIIPLLITMQFLLVGLGVIKDEEAVRAMSRSGDRREILKGPLIYGLVFVAMTLVYWRDSIVGLVTLMVLCGGDGMADIIGSRYGENKIPWAKRKSWQGSLAMFVGALLFVLAVSMVFSKNGFPQMNLTGKLMPISALVLIATLVETIPSGDLDNLFVPLAAVIGSYLFLF